MPVTVLLTRFQFYGDWETPQLRRIDRGTSSRSRERTTPICDAKHEIWQSMASILNSRAHIAGRQHQSEGSIPTRHENEMRRSRGQLIFNKKARNLPM